MKTIICIFLITLLLSNTSKKEYVYLNETKIGFVQFNPQLNGYEAFCENSYLDSLNISKCFYISLKNAKLSVKKSCRIQN